MTRVLIVEDAPMDRQLLELYVKQNDQYELVPSVESAAFAEFCCRTTKVDLILMDVCTSMYANGIDAAEKPIKKPNNSKYCKKYCQIDGTSFLCTKVRCG